MGKAYRYYAFISYSHKDKKIAKWLQQKLESYALPTKIQKRYKQLPPKIKPVFRDLTHLFPKHLDLGATLKEELDQSKTLIVICSPDSAQSRYVGEEISYFKTNFPDRKIIPLIVRGKPYNADISEDCYHRELKDCERLGIEIAAEESNFKLIRKHRAFIRLVAALFDLNDVILWDNYKRRMLKKVSMVLSIVILFCVAIFWVWNSNQPFNMNISLREQTCRNDKLPFGEGVVKIIYDNRIDSSLVKSRTEPIVFNDIPGKYRDKDAKVLFEMYGFCKIDTVMHISDVVNLPIHRDDTFSTIKGYVRNKMSDKFMPDIVVSISGFKAKTDRNGYFEIKIPLELQDTEYPVKVSNKDRSATVQIAYPTQNSSTVINTLYF